MNGVERQYEQIERVGVLSNDMAASARGGGRISAEGSARFALQGKLTDRDREDVAVARAPAPAVALAVTRPVAPPLKPGWLVWT